jgi:tetrahydromethanopterin S-methyltransferase subunit B
LTKPQESPSVQQALATSPKLSKSPKSGHGAIAVDAADLAEIQEEIRKLEKIAKTKPKAVDPFDAKIFNSKYGKEDPKTEPTDRKAIPNEP